MYIFYGHSFKFQAKHQVESLARDKTLFLIEFEEKVALKLTVRV